MKLNRQPNRIEVNFPNMAPLVYRLVKMGEKGKTGIYFDDDGTGRRELPVYEEVKDLLPEPVAGDNKEWVELYKWVWKSAYTRHLTTPDPSTGFISDYIDVGLDKKLYQWDMTFIIMYARYGHRFFPAIQALDNFYAKQREDGLIWRIFDETDGKEHWWGNYPSAVNPPLFAWTELESLKVTGDQSRIRRVLPALEAYAKWINQGMICDKAVHRLYWNSPDGSGMDNTPRGGSGWVDMSCQVVLNHRCMAELYSRIGDKKNHMRHVAEAEKIKERINRWMWDKNDRFYYDVDDKGRKIKVKTIASYWALIAGVASAEQVKAMVGHLKNEDEFWTEVPFPALAKNEKLYDPSGRYWKGGVWPPTNYMTIQGLAVCGYEELAVEATERYLDSMVEILQTTSSVWELQAPERSSSGILKPGTNKDGKTLCGDDFIGWSGVGPVALFIEISLGFRVEGINHLVRWNIKRTDEHGVRRLNVGDARVSLVCRSRESLTDPIIIDAESDREISLILVRSGEEKNIALLPGKTVLEF